MRLSERRCSQRVDKVGIARLASRAMISLPTAIAGRFRQRSLVKPAVVPYSPPYETNVPAEEAQAREDTRVSCALREQERPLRAAPPTPQGPQTPLRLSVPKTYLLSGAEIRSFRAASRLHGIFFSAAVASQPGDAHARIALVVSKKVSPKAAARNALKRRAREVLRGALPSLPPVRIIFTAKSRAAEAGLPEVRADIAKLLEAVRAVAARSERVTMPPS